ncbi:di-trans,poly-cis-decaprenylcistransferase [Candidatus Woesearchaeota archaeon]|nr:di-trans,poly-cis-decaprenylcistransferase [Candidatus Woesearchaeota archaeon]MBW3014467.1 di-trans,poly-cis-decaprenylcistransferase [Candidatus Woesearchaeota archaeon]
MGYPEHIAIILDGNRRFAKKLMQQPWKGHEWGAGKVRKVCDWAREVGIKKLTLWGFSTDNFNRPKREFDYIIKVFDKEIEFLLNDPEIEKNKINIKFIGRIEMFPEFLQKKMKELTEKTKDNSNFQIYIALAYGGKPELIDACQKLAADVKLGKLNPEEINEDKFEEYLYMRDAPDLIIRTGGDKRTSGFLPWQGAYAEYLFMDKCWPEFEKEDLINALDEFTVRERRFGR